MKKRLLISSVLMSAVLACALGTGTYAWYATSAAGNNSLASTNVNLSAAGVSTITASELDVEFTVTGTNESVAMKDDAGQEYAFVKDVLVPIDTSLKPYYTINVTGVDWAEEYDLSEKLSSKATYTVSVSTTNPRFVVRATAPTGTSGWLTGSSVTFDITVNQETGALSMASKTFYVVVDGSHEVGESESPDAASSVSAQLVFTIA